MLFTLKYVLLTKQVLRSTYTKIARWKMLRQGIVSCSRTSICCRFSKKLKTRRKLAVKTSKLHSLRQRETNPSNSPNILGQNRQRQVTLWGNTAGTCFPARSFMLKCPSAFYGKIFFIYLWKNNCFSILAASVGSSVNRDNLRRPSV